MKKTICAAIVLLTLVFFVGCNSNSLTFSAQYVRTNQISSAKEFKYSSVVSFNSLQQLQEYYSDNSEYFDFSNTYDSPISFDDAIKKYDDAFFENHMLAMVLLQEYSGSIRHNVTSTVKSTNGIGININRTSPQVRTGDMAEWHIIVEFEKSDVLENVFSVNLT